MFQRGHHPADAGCDLAREHGTDERTEHDDEQGDRGVDPGGVSADAGGVLRVLHAGLDVLIQGLICGCNRIIDLAHCTFGLQNIERIADLAGRDQSYGAIAIFFIL